MDEYGQIRERGDSSKRIKMGKRGNREHRREFNFASLYSSCKNDDQNLTNNQLIISISTVFSDLVGVEGPHAFSPANSLHSPPRETLFYLDLNPP